MVETLNLLSKKRNGIILLSYEDRNMGDKPELLKLFFQLMEKIFSSKEVKLSEQHPVFQSNDIHIVIFQRKI